MFSCPTVRHCPKPRPDTPLTCAVTQNARISVRAVRTTPGHPLTCTNTQDVRKGQLSGLDKTAGQSTCPGVRPLKGVLILRTPPGATGAQPARTFTPSVMRVVSPA
jgi:hypothetical protein